GTELGHQPGRQVGLVVGMGPDAEQRALLPGLTHVGTVRTSTSLALPCAAVRRRKIRGRPTRDHRPVSCDAPCAPCAPTTRPIAAPLSRDRAAWAGAPPRAR